MCNAKIYISTVASPICVNKRTATHVMYQTNVDSFTFVDTDFRGLWKTCTLWIFDFVVMLKSA